MCLVATSLGKKGILYQLAILFEGYLGVPAGFDPWPFLYKDFGEADESME